MTREALAAAMIGWVLGAVAVVYLGSLYGLALGAIVLLYLIFTRRFA